MRSKRKMPPRVLYTRDGGEQLTLSEELFPIPKYTTDLPDKTSMARVLPKGRENAISGSDLAALLGINDLRSLRHRITFERIRGVPVLSTPGGGYFLPDDGEKGVKEAELFLKVMDARTRTTAEVTEAARRFIRR